MTKEVILTGLRTNSEYHLGNYIGALLPIINLVKDQSTAQGYEINLFAPDLHSFTTPIDFNHLKTQTFRNLKIFVAAGAPLDQPHINLYRQSYIPAHSELTWILSNFTAFGELSRMTEFKDKSQRLKNQDQINVGLFIYPILMAADILLYDAQWVPVGDDQRQHLEFCRHLAKRFNTRFKTAIFQPPASFSQQQAWARRLEAPRIMSLSQPHQKMSKSTADSKGTISLFDPPEAITQKIMGATTDNLACINYDWPNQPGISNLLTILASLKNQPQTEINQVWQGQTNYKNLKLATIEVVQVTLQTLQTNFKQITDQELTTHLIDREAKLKLIAQAKLKKVQQLLGLR